MISYYSARLIFLENTMKGHSTLRTMKKYDIIVTFQEISKIEDILIKE